MVALRIVRAKESAHKKMAIQGNNEFLSLILCFGFHLHQLRIKIYGSHPLEFLPQYDFDVYNTELINSRDLLVHQIIVTYSVNPISSKYPYCKRLNLKIGTQLTYSYTKMFGAPITTVFENPSLLETSEFLD